MTTPENQQDAQFEANYEAFIAGVRQSGQVWGLCDENDEWALCPSALYEETDVVPFWSEELAAKAHCIDEWSHYQPRAISLDEFLGDWLPGMHEDDVLVGPNWDDELEGLEVEPADIAAELDDNWDAQDAEGDDGKQ